MNDKPRNTMPTQTYFTIQFRFGGRWVDMNCYHIRATAEDPALRFRDRLEARDYRRDRIPVNCHVRIAEHAGN